MTKTPDQLKNMCEDWIKIPRVEYENITEKSNEQQDVFDWIFQVGGKGQVIQVSKLKTREDRIHFIAQVNISDPHKQALVDLGSKGSADFLKELNEFAATMGLGIRWKVENGVPVGFMLSGYVDVEELNRPTFFKIWDKISLTKGVLIQKFQTLNPNVTANDVSGTSNKSIYG